MNTPNKLTLLRVLMIPIYLIIWYMDFSYNYLAALAVFVLASLTDLLDGHIARKRGLVTDFGKFMDPLADKILVMTAMACFCAAGVFPVWAFVIVICREFAVSGLRMVAVEGGKVIAAGWSGKIKTASTMICLCVMHFQIPSVLRWICIWVIVMTTVYSGIEYFVKNRDCVDWSDI